ncbi:Hypp6793 [Branchiostoma lanceolatum]|uniref:Hypp6793 protein n=1 Tax=Branchiostoma lanceolatum TaxID=7740 RepID=A0A8J9YVL5_BRALA|nr:Hypp6793 [Branchiostoma lanceolatum]
MGITTAHKHAIKKQKKMYEDHDKPVRLWRKNNTITLSPWRKPRGNQHSHPSVTLWADQLYTQLLETIWASWADDAPALMKVPVEAPAAMGVPVEAPAVMEALHANALARWQLFTAKCLDTVVPLTTSENKKLAELANTLVTNLKVTGQLLGSVCNEITGVRRRRVHEWVDQKYKCLVNDKRRQPDKLHNVDERLTNATCRWLLGDDIIRNIEDCEKTERTVGRLNSSGFAVNNPAFLFNKPFLPKTQQSSGSHSSGGKHHSRGGRHHGQSGRSFRGSRQTQVQRTSTRVNAMQKTRGFTSILSGSITPVAPCAAASHPSSRPATTLPATSWVLQAIQGLKPQLTGRPIQRVAPREQNRSAEETDLISREIQSLLQKGAN